MNGNRFSTFMSALLDPILREMGFEMEPLSINGRHYLARFTVPAHAVWVSYEPREQATFVSIFTRTNGHLSDIDDHLATPRLSDLTARHMGSITPHEREKIRCLFEPFEPENETERVFLTMMKNLCLVLPKHMEKD